MVHFGDTENEDRFGMLGKKATEIRKLLFGVLLLAKEIWKDELEQKWEGIEVLKSMEKTEEAFVDNSLTDGFEKLENILDVIHKRAKGIFELMKYISEDKQKNK